MDPETMMVCEIRHSSEDRKKITFQKCLLGSYICLPGIRCREKKRETRETDAPQNSKVLRKATWAGTGQMKEAGRLRLDTKVHGRMEMEPKFQLKKQNNPGDECSPNKREAALFSSPPFPPIHCKAGGDKDGLVDFVSSSSSRTRTSGTSSHLHTMDQGSPHRTSKPELEFWSQITEAFVHLTNIKL